MAVFRDLFTVHVGTTLGQNAQQPRDLVDVTALVAGIQIQTVSPGGFETCTITFSAPPATDPLSELPYPVAGFNHVQVFAAGALLWEGRAMELGGTGAQPSQAVCEGYGVSALPDVLLNLNGVGSISPYKLLRDITQQHPLFTAADIDAPYEAGLVQVSDPTNFTCAQALDAVCKLGDDNSLPLDWYCWDNRRLLITARIPPAVPQYVIPFDSTVAWKQDFRQTASAVGVAYTFSGQSLVQPVEGNPDFSYDWGLTRTVKVSAGTMTSAQAAQYAAVFLGLHSGPVVSATVTRTGGRGLELSGGGERSGYLVRAGEWAQLGNWDPLQIVRTSYDAASDAARLELGTLAGDLTSMVKHLRSKVNYLTSQINSNSGMPA